MFSAPIGYLTRPYNVYRSRDRQLGSRPASGCLAAVTIAVPYTPLAGPLGLTALAWPTIGALAGIAALDMLSKETAKRRMPPDWSAPTATPTH